MFLENDYARPLFDSVRGGPPVGYMCLMAVKAYKYSNYDCISETCHKITRTERGMRMHLKSVHGWEEQPCLYSTDKQKVQNQAGAPRRLRARKPILKSNDEEQKNMESIQSSQKSPDKNEGELLKLMNEEK